MLRELVRVKEVGLVYRIMIVEDDRELRETLKELLILKNYDVITSGSVKEFDEHTDIYDMYLLDVKLPDGDGFDICERIRHNSDAPIIFITSCDDEESIIKGLDMGGDDYVTKPFHNAVLLSRISANLRRRDMNSGDVYNKGSLSVHFDQYKLYRDGKELKLSSNEWDIIKILIENKGRVVRRDVFFDRLWDMHGNYVEYNTLTVTMSRLKAKLGGFIYDRKFGSEITAKTENSELIRLIRKALPQLFDVDLVSAHIEKGALKAKFNSEFGDFMIEIPFEDEEG